MQNRWNIQNSSCHGHLRMPCDRHRTTASHRKYIYPVGAVSKTADIFFWRWVSSKMDTGDRLLLGRRHVSDEFGNLELHEP